MKKYRNAFIILFMIGIVFNFIYNKQIQMNKIKETKNIEKKQVEITVKKYLENKYINKQLDKNLYYNLNLYNRDYDFIKKIKDVKITYKILNISDNYTFTLNNTLNALVKMEIIFEYQNKKEKYNIIFYLLKYENIWKIKDLESKKI